MNRYNPVARQDANGLFADCELDDCGDFYLVSDVDAQMVPRPDPAEVRKALEKVKRLVKTQQKSCRRHGLTEEIVQAEADLLKLVGVEVE